MTCRGVLMGEGQAARLQPGTGPCAYGLFVYLLSVLGLFLNGLSLTRIVETYLLVYSGHTSLI